MYFRKSDSTLEIADAKLTLSFIPDDRFAVKIFYSSFVCYRRIDVVNI